jgi:xanthosine utilization system XapX-like protein
MRAQLAIAARGAGAGAIASGVMGLLFLGARRTGVVSKVAPEEITETALDAAGLEVAETVEDAASTMSHIAFGAASGALYGLLQRHLPGRPTLAALGFAGLVLVASYEGWVPAVGALPPLHAQTPAGRWTLIAGHAVYGTVLGQLTPDRTLATKDHR